jgi:hypothetical protein
MKPELTLSADMNEDTKRSKRIEYLRQRIAIDTECRKTMRGGFKADTTRKIKAMQKELTKLETDAAKDLTTNLLNATACS